MSTPFFSIPHPSRLLLGLVAALLLLLGAAACTSQRGDRGFGNGPLSDGERSEVRRQIRRLAAAKTMRENPEDEVRYEEAKRALEGRGSTIQGILLEELAASSDWGVRYGIVNVLSSVGTQRMVEPLIHVLDDTEPQVAWMAMVVLQVVCDHRIPDPASTDERFPPFVGDESDLDLNERNWRNWHAMHGRQLRDAWQKWWDENQHRLRIE
ncbi:MAG: HEAT repeat domain-containing protein [Planctomycetota bacterium]|nr:MAG: HEAT repeat domain-containing protein [Planctomycetota bacterium]